MQQLPKTDQQSPVRECRRKKHRKYVVEKGLEPEYFRCIALTDCGMLHEDTKVLIKALAKRADSDPKVIREAFQLENEKFAAYTIVSQLRNHIQGEKWLGGISL